MAAITSEAVAASTNIPPHTLEPIEAKMPIAELPSQSDVGTVDDDDVLLAVQIASWLPESDPLRNSIRYTTNSFPDHSAERGSFHYHSRTPIQRRPRSLR